MIGNLQINLSNIPDETDLPAVYRRGTFQVALATPLTQAQYSRMMELKHTLNYDRATELWTIRVGDRTWQGFDLNETYNRWADDSRGT